MEELKLTPGAPEKTAQRRRASRADPIAEGLRRLWAEAEQETVPDDFLDILDRADAAKNAAKAAKPEGGA